MTTLSSCSSTRVSRVQLNSKREVEAKERSERSSVRLTGVVGVCFLLAGGATSSESELELLDAAALRFRSALMGCDGVGVFGVATTFFGSSSDESDELDAAFFLFLLPFATGTIAAGVAAFF